MIDPRTISRKSIIRIFLTKLPFFFGIFIFFWFFFFLCEKFEKNLRIFRSKWDANPREFQKHAAVFIGQGIISQPRSPRIATRNVRFYRYFTVYALIESSPVHFAFYSDSLERRASILRAVRKRHDFDRDRANHASLHRVHLVFSKGKRMMKREVS